MPIVIHDYMGAGHDLSKGAFDSESIAKPVRLRNGAHEIISGALWYRNCHIFFHIVGS